MSEARKTKRITGHLPTPLFHEVKNSSIAQNVSDTIRLATALRSNGIDLVSLLRKNNLSIESFYEFHIHPKIKENLLFWLRHRRVYSENYTQVEARVSEETASEILKMRQEEFESSLKDTATALTNIDKIKIAIIQEDIDKISTLIAENIVKMFLKGGEL